MEPTPALIDSLRQDKIEQARSMTPEQRLSAGGELFDYACRISMAGIRSQHPDADERQVLHLLRERVALGEQLEAKRVLERDRAGRR